MSKHHGAASVGVNLRSQRSSSGSQILDIQKENLRADCGWNIQQMGSQKQRTPAKLCNVCAICVSKMKGFCTTARPKVTRIEILEKSERASVVERGNTLTGVKDIRKVVNRSLSREYVEMVGIGDGCVAAIWQKCSW